MIAIESARAHGVWVAAGVKSAVPPGMVSISDEMDSTISERPLPNTSSASEELPLR